MKRGYLPPLDSRPSVAHISRIGRQSLRRRVGRPEGITCDADACLYLS